MNVPDLIESTAASLSRGDLSSVAARALLNEVGVTANEIAERVALIRPRTAPGGAGLVRQQLAATGTDAELLALDKEFERLAAQWDRLNAQRDQLGVHRQKALAEESAKNLPDLLKSVAVAVDGLEAAQRAVTDQEVRVRESYRQVSEARGLAHNAGLPTAGAPEVLAQRLMAAMPCFARHHTETRETLMGSV